MHQLWGASACGCHPFGASAVRVLSIGPAVRLPIPQSAVATGIAEEPSLPARSGAQGEEREPHALGERAPSRKLAEEGAGVAPQLFRRVGGCVERAAHGQPAAFVRRPAAHVRGARVESPGMLGAP